MYYTYKEMHKIFHVVTHLRNLSAANINVYKTGSSLTRSYCTIKFLKSFRFHENVFYGENIARLDLTTVFYQMAIISESNFLDPFDNFNITVIPYSGIMMDSSLILFLHIHAHFSYVIQ